jgi:hypothetical protein
MPTVNGDSYSKKKGAIILDPDVRWRLDRLRWFGHVQGMEENRIPKTVLYMNLGTTRLRGGPRSK